MKASVRERWHEFSRPLEGYVTSMYADIKGLITTGVGNLIDPIQLALQLPWKHERTGALATTEEVKAAWNDIKQNAADLSKRHYKYAAIRNDLRLSDADVEALVASKLDEFYAYIKKHHFPEIDSYPADAQLGIMSMAWACGPGFPQTFKNFKRCVLNGDWKGAVETCKIREDNNPGVVPRNKANRRCFQNACLVVMGKIDPDVLWWPEMPVLPPLETETRPPSGIGPDDLTPVPMPLPDADLPPVPETPRNDLPGWIGDPNLGLDDEAYDEMSEGRRKHNLEQK